MASNSGVYTCQVMLTVDGTDVFNYSDISRVTLTGECDPVNYNSLLH